MGVGSFHRILPVAGAAAIVVAMLAVVPATATPARVRTGAALQLSVSPKDSDFDSPLTISISGVKPEQRVPWASLRSTPRAMTTPGKQAARVPLAEDRQGSQMTRDLDFRVPDPHGPKARR